MTTVAQVDAEIQATISHPGTSFWLQNAMRQALLRDPVDAAWDAKAMSEMLQRRADAVIGSRTCR